MGAELVCRRLGPRYHPVRSSACGLHAKVVEPPSPPGERLRKKPRRGVVHAHNKRFSPFGRYGERRRMCDVHVGVTAQRRPVEQVPRVVQDRSRQREHGRTRDRAQVEFGPCRCHFFVAMASYNGPYLYAQRRKVGHQLGRVPAHTAGRRRQELLNVDCDSQGCSSGELRSSR